MCNAKLQIPEQSEKLPWQMLFNLALLTKTMHACMSAADASLHCRKWGSLQLMSPFHYNPHQLSLS